MLINYLSVLSPEKKIKSNELFNLISSIIHEFNLILYSLNLLPKYYINFPAVHPPSTVRIDPVQKVDSSLAKNLTAFDTSSGSPTLFIA